MKVDVANDVMLRYRAPLIHASRFVGISRLIPPNVDVLTLVSFKYISLRLCLFIASNLSNQRTELFMLYQE